MEKSEQELIDIADKMLMDLEKEYWQVQQHNMNVDQLCPQNNQNSNGYQLLGGDDGNYFQNQDEDQQNQQNKEEKEEEGQVQGKAHEELPCKEENAHKQDQQLCGELMQVFPTEQWVPQQKQVNINSEKIKEFTLKMNLPIPDWVNNEDMLKNRIMELFGKKK